MYTVYILKDSQGRLYKGLTRTYLKMHLGSNRRISAAAAFSKLIVLPARIVSAAAASLRNSLDFASQSHFEIGSNNLKRRIREHRAQKTKTTAKLEICSGPKILAN